MSRNSRGLGWTLVALAIGQVVACSAQDDGAGAPAGAGCSSDSDCKLDRICAQSQCVDPGALASGGSSAMPFDGPAPLPPDQRLSAEEALPGTCWEAEARCGTVDVWLYYDFGVNENLSGGVILDGEGQRVGLALGSFDAVAPDAVAVDYEVFWLDDESTIALQHQLGFRDGVVVLPARALFSDCPQLTFRQQDCQNSDVALEENAADDSSESDGESEFGESGSESD